MSLPGRDAVQARLLHLWEEYKYRVTAEYIAAETSGGSKSTVNSNIVFLPTAPVVAPSERGTVPYVGMWTRRCAVNDGRLAKRHSLQACLRIDGMHGANREVACAGEK